MSYYNPITIEFTNHALSRATQRIKECKGLDNFELVIKLRQIFAKSQFDFEDHEYSYFAINSKNELYFVVDKFTGTVITITNISYAKKFQLLTR